MFTEKNADGFINSSFSIANTNEAVSFEVDETINQRTTQKPSVDENKTATTEKTVQGKPAKPSNQRPKLAPTKTLTQTIMASPPRAKKVKKPALIIALLFLTVVMAISTLNASKLMHKTMLDTVLKSPMSYFDTTPLGRIVNR